MGGPGPGREFEPAGGGVADIKLFDRFGQAFVFDGVFVLPGSHGEVGNHIDAGGTMFQPDLGHAQVKLVLSVGEAGEVVGGGSCEVVAVVDVGGAGDGEEGVGMAAGIGG